MGDVAIRNLVTRRIQAELKGIKKADGFKYDAITVRRRNPNKAIVEADTQPAIYLWGANEPHDFVLDPLLNSELELNVMFLCKCKNGDDQEEAGVEFYTDIRNRLARLSPLLVTVDDNEVTVNIRPLGVKIGTGGTDESQAGGHALFAVEFPTDINDGRAVL